MVSVQRTHAAGAVRSFEALRTTYPTWEEVATASVSEIENLIAPGGLAFHKAPRIKRMLSRVLAERGICDLQFLRNISTDEAYKYLVRDLGTGAKTAWCVISYSLARDVFPADVHAIRVLRRLGLLPIKPRHEALNRKIHDYVPNGHRFELHVNLIKLGRDVCKSKPLCGACKLVTSCDFGQARINQENHSEIFALRAGEVVTRREIESFVRLNGVLILLARLPEG